MPGSALLGHPPQTGRDALIYKALLIISPSSINPDKKHPFGPPAPPNAHYQSRATSMIIGVSFAIALVVLITGARLYVRRFVTRAFSLDDWVIIPALFGCVTYLSVNLAQESVGCLGKHLYECTYDELGWYVELAKINFPIFFFTVFTIKISIVLQNRRITGMTSRNWQVAHWIYLGLLICIMPICVFLNAFACSPVATTYTLQSIASLANPRTIKCLNQPAISLATRTLHIITDWLLLPVPLIILYRLQMPLKKKIRLGFLFCLGLTSSIATIVRNVLITSVHTDLTYDYYSIYAWDVVDIFFATVVASLPALNSVVDPAMSKIKSLSFGSKSSQSTTLLSSTKGTSRRHQNALSTKSSTAHGGYAKQQSKESLDPQMTHRADIELTDTLEDTMDYRNPSSGNHPWTTFERGAE